ncbi:MAG: hypothetical protein IPK60_20555 [Sandaracinaceae bacterium]|nr:hypothetical protein [Sandaracinaceae bacterium]
MKNSALDQTIRSRVDAFVINLTNLALITKLQSVHGAFRARLDTSSVAPTKRGPGRPRSSEASQPIAAAPKPSRKAKRRRRTIEAVLKTAADVLAYIKAHEGERLEQIGQGLGIATKDLKFPIQKLFEQKAIKTTGDRRGTKYFVK